MKLLHLVPLLAIGIQTAVSADSPDALCPPLKKGETRKICCGRIQLTHENKKRTIEFTGTTGPTNVQHLIAVNDVSNKHSFNIHMKNTCGPCCGWKITALEPFKQFKDLPDYNPSEYSLSMSECNGNKFGTPCK